MKKAVVVMLFIIIIRYVDVHRSLLCALSVAFKPPIARSKADIQPGFGILLSNVRHEVISDVRQVAQRSKELSDSATSELLRVLDSDEIRVHLRNCCGSVSSLSSLQLLQKLQEEVAISEL